MKQSIKRVSIDLAGYSFIIVGLVAIPVPIISGIPIVLFGVYLLSLHSIWFRKQLKKLSKRFPVLFGFIDAVDVKVRKFLNIPA